MNGTFYPDNDYRNYLAHFGVKGMKWGVRKDRNRSAKGNFYRVSSAGYDLQSKIFSKLGAKKMAAMSRSVSRYGAKKASEADAAKAAGKRQASNKHADQTIERVANAAYGNMMRFPDTRKAIQEYVNPQNDKSRSAKARLKVERLVDEAVYEHPTSSKTFNRYHREDDGFDTMEYGQEIVKSVMGRLDAEAKRRRDQDAEVKRLMKKHPQLKRDFGGPDMIDDYEYFQDVASQYESKR